MGYGGDDILKGTRGVRIESQAGCAHQPCVNEGKSEDRPLTSNNGEQVVPLEELANCLVA